MLARPTGNMALLADGEFAFGPTAGVILYDGQRTWRYDGTRWAHISTAESPGTLGEAHLVSVPDDQALYLVGFSSGARPPNQGLAVRRCKLGRSAYRERLQATQRIPRSLRPGPQPHPLYGSYQTCCN